MLNKDGKGEVILLRVHNQIGSISAVFLQTKEWGQAGLKYRELPVTYLCKAEADNLHDAACMLSLVTRQQAFDVAPLTHIL